jgi:hypothetical protein
VCREDDPVGKRRVGGALAGLVAVLLYNAVARMLGGIKINLA